MLVESLLEQSQVLNSQEMEAVVDSLCSTLCQHSYTDHRKALLSHRSEILGSLRRLCSCEHYTLIQDVIHSSLRMTLK